MLEDDYCAGLTEAQFVDLPLSARIHLVASEFLGWRYGRDIRYPRVRPMLPSRLVDPRGQQIDCSSLTTYVLVSVFPHGEWSMPRYRELQIFDVRRPWSPLEAVEAAGVGVAIDGPEKGAWALSQAWKDASIDDGDGLSGGHARIVYFRSEDDLLVLESTSRGRLGPRWTQASYSNLCRLFPAGVKFSKLVDQISSS